MKKALLVLPVILFLFFESCSDDFNINDPNHQDIYFLNCILRNDNSIQYATLLKNIYTENGAPPASNSTEQYVQGANIKIFYNDSVSVMKDTTIELTGSENTRINCFYVNDLVIRPGKVYKIEASLQGGKKLESTIQVPYISYRNFSSSFPQFLQGKRYQEKPYYSWSWYDNNGVTTNILNLPQLEIYYQKYEGGIYIDKKILVPLALYYNYDENNNIILEYVKLSFDNYCITTLETVNKTMQEISGDDPNKKNYVVNKVLFRVIGLDPELSKYYSAYNTFAEDFTIKLRQTDYSNILGGKGIFGVYYKYSKPLTVDSLYITSFGYQYKKY